VGRRHQQAAARRLYSEQAGTPLLGRATQGQFAPGSTWKPFMTAGALTNGYPRHPLDCSSGFQVGNRVFKNYESGAYGYIGFAKALEVSCNTFFYRVGYDFWQQFGSDVADVDAATRWSRRPRRSASAARPASTCPGEAPAGSPTASGSCAYYEVDEGLLLRHRDKPQDGKTSDFVYKFAASSARGLRLPGRRRGELRDRPGRHDRHAAPAGPGYAALSNGGTLYAPRVGKAIVSPDGTVLQRIQPQGGGTSTSRSGPRLHRHRAQGVTRVGTMAWKLGGFPLDDVTIRAKTGSAEVYGKQSTSWVASYTEDYVVVMMVSQGGTGSGTSGRRSARSGRRCTASTAMDVRPATAAIPGHAARTAADVREDGSILPPPEGEEAMHGPPTVAPRRAALRARARLGAAGRRSALRRSAPARLVGHRPREDLTGGDPTAYLRKQLVNVAIGLVLMVMVLATDHRWVRILAPLVYLASSAGWCWC
jgi:penicillin-binding protein 2